MTREDIANQLKKFTENTTNPDQIKELMRIWLENQETDDFTQKQIMNDLTSYPEYLNILN